MIYNLGSGETVSSQDFGRESSHTARQPSDGMKGQGTPGKNGRTVTCLLGGVLGAKASFSLLRAGG